jgi:hypothetical protein
VQFGGDVLDRVGVAAKAVEMAPAGERVAGRDAHVDDDVDILEIK